MTLEEQVAELQQRMRAQERDRQELRAELQAVRQQRPRVMPGTALLVVAVLALTALCGSRAYAVVQTPSHTEFTVSLTAGGSSMPIPWPVANSPISLTAASTRPSPSALGIAFMHAVYGVQGTGEDERYIYGNGQHADGTPALLTTHGDGRELLRLVGDAVTLRVVTTGSTTNPSPSHFKIVNTSQGPVTVVIEMTW